MTPMTFDSFVATPSSARVRRMCRSFGRSDDRRSRVLLMHGTTGTGKSHLLAAVEHVYSSRRPGDRVMHATAADMADALVSAIRADQLPQLEAAWAAVSLFLVDDLHALWQKTATQEFLGTALGLAVTRGARVIGAATAPMQALAPFRSACERSSAIQQCSVPTPGVREIRTILATMTSRRAIKLSAAMSVRVARHCRGDVRRAIGALNQLEAQRRLSVPRSRLPWIAETAIAVSW